MSTAEQMLSTDPVGTRETVSTPAPRLGFLGVGWIGRNRMEAIAASGLGEVAAVADPSGEMRSEAVALAPDCAECTTYEELLAQDLDAVVIATPSALHARQTIQALESGLAVFCQKPLGRTEAEVRDVVQAARTANLLLGVDFSYRFAETFRAVQELVASGELGHIYALDLTFHNAYGPDKSWFYDPAQAGGGAVMDLGIHLVDTAVWMLGGAAIDRVQSRLLSGGKPVSGDQQVEDFATATLEFETGAVARLACSWNLPAGRDAVIEVEVFGTRGGAAVRNVEGSFYDFTAERFRGTSTETLVSPPDQWGGRAAVAWADRLAAGKRFDAEGAAELVEVARTLDLIYGR